MQYALASDNEVMFDQAYKQLQTYYVIRPDLYIAWKLDPQGKAHVPTNALGDDLRIMGLYCKQQTDGNKAEQTSWQPHRPFPER